MSDTLHSEPIALSYTFRSEKLNPLCVPSLICFLTVQWPLVIANHANREG